MYLLNRWSLEQDRTGDIQLARKLEKLSGAGHCHLRFHHDLRGDGLDHVARSHLVLDGLRITALRGPVFSALATIVAVLVLLAGKPPLAGLITKRHLHDLGKLMLALTMLWAYLSFSQLILIWSGNLPEEITYYINRLNGGWEWVGGDPAVLFTSAFPSSCCSRRR